MSNFDIFMRNCDTALIPILVNEKLLILVVIVDGSFTYEKALLMMLHIKRSFLPLKF